MLANILHWTLIILLAVAATIGFLFVTRGTALRRVRGVEGDDDAVAPSEAAFPVTIAMLTGATLLKGARVELALNGDGTFESLWSDLRSAERVITLQMYYAGPGRVADELAEILLERVRAGVGVYFLYDAFGVSDLPRAYWRRLREGGVRAIPFRPLRFRNLWVVQNRAHIRGIVVDGRVGWTGGFGIDDKWLGDGHTALAWRETNVRFQGPVVAQLLAAFAAAWAEATGDLVSGRFIYSASLEGDGEAVSAAAILATAPTLGSTSAERFLALSVAGARERIYVTNAYFAPDRAFTALLVTAAARGVDVRVLVGGPQTDVRAARLAAQARYEQLLSGAVRVFEYQPSTLHAKTFVVDGCWSSVGTMNFDNRSLALNDEVTLMVLDRPFARQMEQTFHNDLSRSLEIDLAIFRQRPWHAHVSEWGANLVAPLL